MGYSNAVIYTIGVSSSDTVILANDTSITFSNTTPQLKKYVRVVSSVYPGSTWRIKVNVQIVSGPTTVRGYVSRSGSKIVGSDKSFYAGAPNGQLWTWDISGFSQNDTIDLYFYVDSGSALCANMRVCGDQAIVDDIYNSASD